MAERGRVEGGEGQGAATHLMRRTLIKALTFVLALPVLLPFAPALKADMAAPDFSAVTTRAAARKLAREGRLVEIHLFPTELGGPDDPENLAYVTPEAADARAMVIGTLRRYLEEDVIDQLDVAPEYEGDSMVPVRIVMTASHSGRSGRIAMTIVVW